MGNVLTMEQDLFATNQYSTEFIFAQEIARSPLLVRDCQQADVVYVPLEAQWAYCAEWSQYFEGTELIRTKIDDFSRNLKTILPLWREKPHFMAISRLAVWGSGLNLQAFLDVGMTILTIEGDGRPELIEVPYPGQFHWHAGLQQNRFIKKALAEKARLAFQAFMIEHNDMPLSNRAELYDACSSTEEDCQHSFPAQWSSDWAEQFYQNASQAWFCIQPAGDSATRRSTFDCLLAGSIPVFFQQSSIDRFPWIDMIDPSDMTLLLTDESVHDLFRGTLAAIPLTERCKKLRKIAQFAHLYQYSLTPHSGSITWANIAHVNGWDDAFTFALKALLRSLQRRGRLSIRLRM